MNELSNTAEAPSACRDKVSTEVADAPVHSEASRQQHEALRSLGVPGAEQPLELPGLPAACLSGELAAYCHLRLTAGFNRSETPIIAHS